MACPYATNIGGCTSCSTIFNQVERLMKHNPIAVEKGKEYCGACGCVVRVKVLIPNETLDRAEGQEKPPYHERCWRLPEGGA
jgi:hypothetical protein